MVEAGYRGVSMKSSGQDIILILAFVAGLIVVFYWLAKREIGNLGSGAAEALSNAGAAAKQTISYYTPDFLKTIDQRTGYLRSAITGAYTVPVTKAEEIQAAGDIAWANSFTISPKIQAAIDAAKAGVGTIIGYKETNYPQTPAEAVTQGSEYYFDVDTGTFRTR